jgi:hypothetical protein
VHKYRQIVPFSHEIATTLYGRKAIGSPRELLQCDNDEDGSALGVKGYKREGKRRNASITGEGKVVED